MWLHQVTVDKNVHKYISPKLCLTPEIKSKYFRIGECVGIGQTTVPSYKSLLCDWNQTVSDYMFMSYFPTHWCLQSNRFSFKNLPANIQRTVSRTKFLLRILGDDYAALEKV